MKTYHWVKSLSPGFFTFRSSHRRCSIKDVLKNFTKFTGRHLCQSPFFNKVAGLRPVTLLKKRLQRRCFPVNFVKFLRTPFLQNTSRRLLLYFHESFFFLRPTIRSSRPEMFCKKGVLKNFAKFKGKQYFNKVAGVSFMENETQAQAFSREFCEIFRSSFYAEYLFLTETVFQINSNSYKRKVSSKLNFSFRGKIVAEIFTLL